MKTKQIFKAVALSIVSLSAQTNFAQDERHDGHHEEHVEEVIVTGELLKLKKTQH